MRCTVKKNSVDMTKGNIFRHIITFAVPLMLTGILQVFYNVADMVVVGRFSGENALAAVGSTSSPINLVINIFTGLSSAAGVIAARRFGAKDENGVQKVVHTSVWVSIIGGLAVTIIGFFITRPLLTAMGSPKEIIDLSVLYMRIYFIGMPAMLFYNFTSAVLRSVGDTKRPMYILSASGIINIILNLVFVVGFKRSVDGVAMGTVASQLFAAIMILRIFLKTDECYKLVLSKLRINARVLREILYLGIPAGIQGAAFSISNMTIQSAVNSVGASAMAANAAAQNIDDITYAAIIAFHHAALTFIGQNYGAFEFKRITKGFWTAICTVMAVGLVFGITICATSRTLLLMFTENPATIELARMRLFRITGLYFLCGMMDVAGGALRAFGLSVFPMVVTIAGVCGLRILIVTMCAPYVTATDLIPVYNSYPITWTLVLLIHVITFSVVKHCKEKITTA